MRYEWWVPDPTILLLSTSDTDLITARSSDAQYRWANPSRLVDGELDEQLNGADLVVVRILGGYRSWQDGIDTVVASGVPTVVVSGEQVPDADLMSHSTVPAGVAVQAHIYLAQGGVENLRQLHAFLCDTVLMTGFGFGAPVTTPSWGILNASRRRQRRPDDRRALLPGPAAGRQHRIRRSTVRRNRRRRWASAAGVLRLAADRRAGDVGRAEIGRRDGDHRAGRRGRGPCDRVGGRQ